MTLSILAATMLGVIGPSLADTWPSASQVVSLLEETVTNLPAFEKAAETALYTRDNLEQYLPTEAKDFLAYRYQWTVAGRFAHKASNVVVVVEVFGFETDLDAFGACTIRRDPRIPGELVPLPNQVSPVSAYWSGSQLHVWRGPLYLRLTPDVSDKQARAPVLELASALVEKLPTMERDPPIFLIAPARGLVAESVKFVRQKVLGQEFLKDGLLATYGRRTAEHKLQVSCELVLLDAATPAAATETYATLLKFLSEAAAPRPLAALGQTAAVMRHERFASTYVMRQGRYVVMLYQVKDPGAAEALLREMGTRIRLAQESASQVSSGD